MTEGGLGYEVATRGFAIVEDVLTDAQCDELIAEIDRTLGSEAIGRAGVRDALRRLPAIRQLADSVEVRSVVADGLSPDAHPVRSILFDKTPEANWLVPWHQDTAIALAERVDGVEGYGPWSVKNGIVHVRPPASVLDHMVTIRVHLDECGPENGALRILPGSHRMGIQDTRPLSIAPHVCPVPRGGIMLMKPLLWHSSSRATEASHRRVIHIEFADAELPAPLEWYEQEQSRV